MRTCKGNCLTRCSLRSEFFKRHNSSLVCMVGISCVYIDTVFGFWGTFLSFSTFFFNPSLLLSWMFEHDFWTHAVLGCHICMCVVFLYVRLFSAVQHVSHGKALKKYAHHHHHQ